MSCLIALTQSGTTDKATAVWSRLNTYATFQAVVTALENILADPMWRPFPLRLQAERNAMIILKNLMPNNVNLAVKAGAIKRWLAWYPFTPTKLAAIKSIKEGNVDDTLMQDILFMLENNPDSRKQLRIAGLMGSSWGETLEDGHFFVVNQRDDPDITPHRRFIDESPEERRLRRRRREAMVLSDGAQPLGRANIIQRRSTGPRAEGPPEQSQIFSDEEIRGMMTANMSHEGSSNQASEDDGGDIIGFSGH